MGTVRRFLTGMDLTSAFHVPSHHGFTCVQASFCGPKKRQHFNGMPLSFVKLGKSRSSALMLNAVFQHNLPPCRMLHHHPQLQHQFQWLLQSSVKLPKSSSLGSSLAPQDLAVVADLQNALHLRCSLLTLWELIVQAANSGSWQVFVG